MQKHASLPQYHTVFDPLPFPQNSLLHYDRHACPLPHAEDFPYLHYHTCYEIGFCESGDGLFLSEGHYFSVSPGDCLFLAPGHRHYSRSLTKSNTCRCWFVYLKQEAVLPLLPKAPHADIPTVIRPTEHPQAAALLRELVLRAQDQDPLRERALSLGLALFLTEANRWFSQAHTPPSPAAHAPDDVITKMAEYLSLHYRDNTSSAELAKLCHLSTSQLRRRFTALYGMPPIAYRNAIRTHLASELLLRTNRSIADIAEQLGYPSPSDFYRMFRKDYGTSPSDYRKQQLCPKEIPKIS